MKYLISGASLFIIDLFVLIGFPRIFFPNIHPVPQWFSIILVIISALYIFISIQTMRIEKKYFAGILFFLLSIITLLTLSLGNMRV